MSSEAVNDFAAAVLVKISPSGALAGVAREVDARTRFDDLAADFRADEEALARLREPTLVDRLENDFARAVPLISDAAVPLETWAIPLLTGLLGGPLAPLLSVGIRVACSVALLALQTWAKKRLAHG